MPARPWSQGNPTSSSLHLSSTETFTAVFLPAGKLGLCASLSTVKAFLGVSRKFLPTGFYGKGDFYRV